MPQKTPASRALELRQLLVRANRAYYVDATPIMGDVEFDRLLAELADIEKAHPELDDPDSPTHRVGGEPIAGFRAIAHALPMLSIDNTYSPADVRDWWARMLRGLSEVREPGSLFGGAAQPNATDFGRLACCCDPKIDGIAISLRYEQGILVYAVTRGDGVKGDDVTHAARAIRAIPLRLEPSTASSPTIPDILEIRGEIYFPTAEFERVNRERDEAGDELFMNPRNAAAGTLKNLDPKVAASRKLGFVAHGRGLVQAASGMPIDPQFSTSHSGFLTAIKSLGVPMPRHLWVVDTIDDVLATIDRFQAQRHSLPYATDGMVVRLDDVVLQNSLGTTSKSPRWVIAYKYPAEQKRTTLLSVAHQVGKTGKITPRATMEPVLLGGSIVQHATLHNYGRINDAPTETEGTRTDIRIGDTVLIEKAGEIIPYVAGVVLSARPGSAARIVAPTACPVCDGTVEVEPPESLEHPGLETQRRCVNPECPAQVREKLIWFAGRKQMDIDGLGEKTVDLIRSTTGAISIPIPLNSFADIFRLHHHREQLINLDRMGEKKVDNLLAGIEKAKSRGMAKLLAGLGIRHVGDSTAKTLAKHFASIEDLLQAPEPMLRPKAMTKDEAAKFGMPLDPKDRPSTDLGSTTAPIVYAYFHSRAACQMFQELAGLGVDLSSHEFHKFAAARTPGAGADSSATSTSDDNPFSGKTIVITGTLDSFEREALKDLLESNGAKVSGSVSGKTTLLIAGRDAGSKLDKARELGIRIMEEPELLVALRACGITPESA